MNRARGTEALRWLRHALKWLTLGVGVAILAGTASAWFLLALAWATETREAHRWLLALLPLAGFAVGWVYLHVGQPVVRAPWASSAAVPMPRFTPCWRRCTTAKRPCA